MKLTADTVTKLERIQERYETLAAEQEEADPQQDFGAYLRRSREKAFLLRAAAVLCGDLPHVTLDQAVADYVADEREDLREDLEGLEDGEASDALIAQVEEQIRKALEVSNER
jgi:hypothetical protein